jgi:hypothetical protein
MNSNKSIGFVRACNGWILCTIELDLKHCVHDYCVVQIETFISCFRLYLKHELYILLVGFGFFNPKIIIQQPLIPIVQKLQNPQVC